MRQRAGRGDDAGGHTSVVAISHHDRQRDQAHGNNRGRDHAGGGGEQGADKDHGIGKAATHRAEQLADGVEQVFRHAGSFKYQAHECEEWDGQQRIVAHDAIDALGQSLQEVGYEKAELDANQRENQTNCAE